MFVQARFHHFSLPTLGRVCPRVGSPRRHSDSKLSSAVVSWFASTHHNELESSTDSAVAVVQILATNLLKLESYYWPRS